MYNYFASFSYSLRGGVILFGNYVFSLESPIRSEEDIREVESSIKENWPDRSNIKVISFQLLAYPE